MSSICPTDGERVAQWTEAIRTDFIGASRLIIYSLPLWKANTQSTPRILPLPMASVCIPSMAVALCNRHRCLPLKHFTDHIYSRTPNPSLCFLLVARVLRHRIMLAGIKSSRKANTPDLPHLMDDDWRRKAD